MSGPSQTRYQQEDGIPFQKIAFIKPMFGTTNELVLCD